MSATSACLEPERSLISIVYSVFVTYSTVGFGDIIPFENHKYVFMISVLPGLSFMSSSIDSAVAYMEKSSKASTRCFDLANCLSTKREGRITADGAQQDTQNNNEPPYEMELVSNDCRKDQNKLMTSGQSQQAQ